MQKRSGKSVEIAFVTLLAMAILFWILYTLLPEKLSNGGEGSHLTPPIRLSAAALTG